MTSTSKILIIDDSKNECFLLSEYLSSSKTTTYEIHTACSPTDGREILNKHAIDCIIVDHLMGAESGLDFIKSFKGGANKHIPVIVISGYADPALEKTALDAGADFFMAKRTLTEDRLKTAISRFLPEAA